MYLCSKINANGGIKFMNVALYSIIRLFPVFSIHTFDIVKCKEIFDSLYRFKAILHFKEYNSIYYNKSMNEMLFSMI